MIKNKSKIYRLLSLSAGIVILDQLSKQFLERVLEKGSITIIPNLFELKLSYNTGAGFSILHNQNTFLILLGLVVIAGLGYYFSKAKEEEYLPLSIILGGAFGNLIDRILHNHVIDFISVSVWPIFNIADIAISCGVAYLIYVIYQDEKKSNKKIQSSKKKNIKKQNK